MKYSALFSNVADQGICVSGEIDPYNSVLRWHVTRCEGIVTYAHDEHLKVIGIKKKNRSGTGSLETISICGMEINLRMHASAQDEALKSQEHRRHFFFFIRITVSDVAGT
jgi:hypothetical protein